VLGETRGGGTKRISRLLKSRSAPKNAAYTVRRISQGVLEPVFKGAVHEARRLVFGGDLEKWIDTCFDRTLPQQIATECMDGADPGEFEVRQGFRQSRRPLRCSVLCVSGALDLCAQPQFHFAGGLFGESDGDDA